MKKHLVRRLLSLALALIMILGILPTNLGLSTEAATPAEESKAQSLLTEINALEGNMYSKYVRVTTLKATSTSQITTANNTLKGLSGNYIAVAKDPITAGGNTYYALNMGRSHAYNKYGVDVVQVIGDQLYGADPLGAINIAYDQTGSETAIKGTGTTYYQQTFPTSSYSGRARYFLTTNNGKYINVSNTNEKVTLQNTKISTTLFADYTLGTVRVVVSGGYYHDQDKVSHKGIGLYTDGAVLNAAYMNEECQKFYLYKERTDRVNVDALYHALMEARTYLENPNAYDGSKFSAFLAEVEQGIYWYNQCNKDTQSSSLVSIYQPTVDQWAQSLTEATSRLKPYDRQINELQIPVTRAVTDKNAIGNGNTYFMLGRDDNGFYRAIDIRNPSAATAEYKHYAVFAIDVVDGKVLSDNLYGSFWISTTPGQGIGLLAYKSGYLNTKSLSSGTNADLTTSNLQYYGIKNEVIGDYPGAFYVYRGASNDVTYINCNGYSYRAMKTSSPSHRDYNMFFFQVSPLTLKLFKALEYVEPFAGGNADGRYDETLYAEFTETLDRALMEYREHRNTMEDSTLQPTLDALAEELQSYAGKLTNADSKASYIDIPVEILDFASDKLLFEFYSGSNGNRFSLQDHTSVQGSVANDTLLKPLVDAYLTATSRIKDELDTVNVAVRQNILLDELQDGHPVYAEYTVGYVAAAILTEWMADSTDTHQTTYASQVKAFNDGFADTQWQDAFWNRMVELYSAYKSGNATKKQEVLGTYDATVQKAGSDGMLLWSEVENGTAFDLAYYILSGVWKPVTDVLPDGRTYNTVVNERDTIRMYYDASIDRYVIASANELVYDGYAFYNTYPFMDRVEKKIFNLSPIDGLGFEKNGVKTDPSNYYGTQAGWQPEYANTNVSFTLHASGMFIYYEDQEQMFDFVGDDDVYFFINDKLVMDIGGTHSAAYFSMNLKEANEKYSLGMEDGGIYSFDMFYADRHTHGSNMKFSTNIKIVSSETMTSKGQYAVEVVGTSTVGANGKGGEMIDNQLVNVGDVVAYSFEITNRRDCPVTNLEFHDDSLGVHLNGDNILTYPATLSTGKEVASLTNPNLCNGVVTQFKDLILEYTTLNSDGTLATGPVTEIAPTDMINLIRSKVTSTDVEYNYAPLDAGIYRVPVATAQQLGNLLKEGLPMECRISLYGFMRKTISTDAPYANELTTYCSYRRSANKDAEFATITGKASRILRVPAATEMPDIPRIEITLDYGKPVQIPLADITNQIFFEKDSPASVGEIVGYV
ncbi:MAG: fibro-slime domain-containing protein, partial [Oscillospiraceae bacterium]|nr:fibro-slime domain-containing protein [Oscillospiraceae bacterium]